MVGRVPQGAGGPCAVCGDRGGYQSFLGVVRTSEMTIRGPLWMEASAFMYVPG